MGNGFQAFGKERKFFLREAQSPGVFVAAELFQMRAGSGLPSEAFAEEGDPAPP